MKLKIDEWRRLKNISQKELAERCGVSLMTIRAWEENPGKIKIENTNKLALALEVNPEDVIFLPNNTN